MCHCATEHCSYECAHCKQLRYAAKRRRLPMIFHLILQTIITAQNVVYLKAEKQPRNNAATIALLIPADIAQVAIKQLRSHGCRKHYRLMYEQVRPHFRSPYKSSAPLNCRAKPPSALFSSLGCEYIPHVTTSVLCARFPIRTNTDQAK